MNAFGDLFTSALRESERWLACSIRTLSFRYLTSSRSVCAVFNECSRKASFISTSSSILSFLSPPSAEGKRSTGRSVWASRPISCPAGHHWSRTSWRCVSRHFILLCVKKTKELYITCCLADALKCLSILVSKTSQLQMQSLLNYVLKSSCYILFTSHTSTTVSVKHLVVIYYIQGCT